MTTAPSPSQPSRFVAAVAAAAALGALLLGGTLMALPASRGAPAAAWLVALASAGPVALAAISLFDICSPCRRCT